ncbi:MAG: type II toxin-antitoxin system death-on-curing family toxin [Methylorubrum populi]
MNSDLKIPTISPELVKDYERDARSLINYQGSDNVEAVDPIDILRAHYVVVDFCLSERIGEGIGGVGPRSFDLLVSAVDRQSVSLGQQFKWPTNHEKIATLVYGIVKNHPFHDANKRTALLVLLYAFYYFGMYVVADKSDLEDIIVYLADDKLHLIDSFAEYEDLDDGPIHFLAEYFRKNTRPIDKRTYFITYRELDRRLHNYGFSIANPDRNYADIVRISDSQRVCKIGFPGWSRQMSRNDMRKVLEACNLTHEQGIDAQVFFFDADPVFAFASDYRSQLASLAYR